MEQHGLDGSKGGGAHMFREVWNPAVSNIYKDVLGTSMGVIQFIAADGLIL